MNKSDPFILFIIQPLQDCFIKNKNAQYGFALEQCPEQSMIIMKTQISSKPENGDFTQ